MLSHPAITFKILLVNIYYVVFVDEVLEKEKECSEHRHDRHWHCKYKTDQTYTTRKTHVITNIKRERIYERSIRKKLRENSDQQVHYVNQKHTV